MMDVWARRKDIVERNTEGHLYSRRILIQRKATWVVWRGDLGQGVKDLVYRAKDLNSVSWEKETNKFFKQNELLRFNS